MKKIIFLFVIIAFASCSKKEDLSPATLNITNSQWYLTRNGIGGGYGKLENRGFNKW